MVTQGDTSAALLGPTKVSSIAQHPPPGKDQDQMLIGEYQNRATPWWYLSQIISQPATIQELSEPLSALNYPLLIYLPGDIPPDLVNLSFWVNLSTQSIFQEILSAELHVFYSSSLDIQFWEVLNIPTRSCSPSPCARWAMPTPVAPHTTTAGLSPWMASD